MFTSHPSFITNAAALGPAGALAVSAIYHAARVATVDLPGAQKAVKDCALATMALQGGPLLQGLEPHPIMEDLLGQVRNGLHACTRVGVKV